MISVDELDRLRFRPRFQHLRAALQLQVLDHRDDISIGKNITIGVFHDAVAFGRLFERPLVATGDTLEVVFEGEDIVHFAHRAGG